MSLAVLFCRARSGVKAPLVTIEVHLSNGLPALNIVGLPELAVRESKDRVRGALLNSRFEFPARRITVNLAPADLPKEGAGFDLPIALGILAASGQIPRHSLHNGEYIGELALSGELRPISGALPVALAASAADRRLILPVANADEAALVPAAEILGASTLLEVCGHLSGESLLSRHIAAAKIPGSGPSTELDLADVQGQAHAKRALTIAAAGNHSLLMSGPPGSGKSMLAQRLPSILPPLSEEEALESAAIRSICNIGFTAERWRERPFRAPHHTASNVALAGGGSTPRPGEISLAHNGILFLDELPEFDRRALEVLREPLERGEITISRAGRQALFPARFQLIAAMNPCPCGYLGSAEQGNCRCTQEQIARYRNRLSGPLLDRIDMHLEVPRLMPGALAATGTGEAESSACVAERIADCQALQMQRNGCLNSQLLGEQLDRHCRLGGAEEALLLTAMERLRLSARAYHRILRLSRTIADLNGSDAISDRHIGEAIGYRRYS